MVDKQTKTSRCLTRHGHQVPGMMPSASFGHRHDGHLIVCCPKTAADWLRRLWVAPVPLTAYIQQVNRMLIVKMFTYWVYVGTQAVEISP